MGYGNYLKELLRPMGVYRLEGSVGGGELACVGAALDGCGGGLEELEREMLVSTAQDRGLEAVEGLLRRRPVAQGARRRGEALAALLRIGGDSFTLDAINGNLKGCGLDAVASETGRAGYVEVRFPEIAGIPPEFEALREIIEDILPCHLEISYVFRYITWARMEARFGTWGGVEAGGYDWESLEKLVEED